MRRKKEETPKFIEKDVSNLAGKILKNAKSPQMVATWAITDIAIQCGRSYYETQGILEEAQHESRSAFMNHLASKMRFKKKKEPDRAIG